MKSWVMDLSKSYQYAMVDAVIHFKLDPTSMLHVKTVFKHLPLLLLIGMFVHPFVMDLNNHCPRFGRVAEILGDGSVQTIPLYYG